MWVIADALQGQIYLQRFERSAEGTPIPIDELRIDRAEDWLPQPDPDVWLTGPGVKAHADHIPQDCHIVPETDREPSVVSLFAVGKALAPASLEEIGRQLGITRERVRQIESDALERLAVQREIEALRAA